MALAALAGAMVACDAGETKIIGTDRPSAACRATPSAPPDGIGAFYTRALDASGIPIIASDRPDAAALEQACLIVVHMLAQRDDVRRAMIQRRMRVAVIARDEVTTDLPEYDDLYEVFPGPDWDGLRGVGATLARPVSSFGEENMLCLGNDPYKGESVMVQTFSSAVLLGMQDVEPSYVDRLQRAYADARDAGLWRNTFADEDRIAYYAMGVQSWFDANGEASPANGIHNDVDTRGELRAYDPTLAGLVAETMPDDAWRPPRCP
jgi:hypothetical protein